MVIPDHTHTSSMQYRVVLVVRVPDWRKEVGCVEAVTRFNVKGTLSLQRKRVTVSVLPHLSRN